VAAGIVAGWISPFWINAVFAIIAMLLAYTLVNRVRQGLREAQIDSSSA
jgi:CDP-diacylglycerol--glycerol-3-phosphate 3-phosphatidyltransferase